PDIGLLVVDQTASMGVGRRAALAAAAAARIEADARKLPDFELRTVIVPEQGSEGTLLFAAVDRALADIPRARLAGIVAITDGEVHDVPKPGARPFGGAPLHVLIPARGEETDRRIRLIEAPGYGIVGKSVRLRLIIEDRGVANNGLARGGAAELTLRRDGERPIVESVPLGVPHEIDLPITRGGPSVVELTASPLPGEVSTVNNTAVVQINGVRDRLRVLLVSGEPHPGERTWRRLLKSDPAVDLVHFTILRPPEKDDLTPLNELALIAFPVHELFQVKIRQFDLIILDRFQNRGLLPAAYLRNIADYVRAGGALLMSVGPEFAGPTSLALSPLGAVLPAQPAPGAGGVVDGAFRPLITPLGTRHPVTQGLAGWKPDALPAWGPWYRHILPADVQGEVLMAAPDGTPLLVLNRVGQGRVAMLLSDQIWLWSRDHQGGGPQAELLRRVAHWLMKEPELEENALTATVAHGALRVERRSTEAAPPPPVKVTPPDGAPRRLDLAPAGPGRAVGTLPASLPGVWRISDGQHTTYAAAGAANPLELADLRATALRLAPLVRASAGSVHWLDDGTPGGHVPQLRRSEPGRETAGGGWIGMLARHDHLVTGVAATALLPPWLALPLILGLALLAWRREGA
ncbi:MAG: hypothetical protein KGJ41_00990, partial [Rhodospirillales bacterium]|nr:hypothetical protein [Rhodospirillales bacterium]